MKKTVLSLIVVIAMSSCNSVKNMNTSNIAQATQLLSALTPNSTVKQISNLFTLLDANKDKGISSAEAIGSIADNFKVLDKDSNSNIDVKELSGLLGLLK